MLSKLSNQAIEAVEPSVLATRTMGLVHGSNLAISVVELIVSLRYASAPSDFR